MAESSTEPRLLEEIDRILEAAEGKRIVLRVIGAVAFRLHCRKYQWLHEKLGRVISDIDFAGYGRQSSEIRDLFRDLGYGERGMINVLYGKMRLIFYDNARGGHVDVFLDKLRFNHVIEFNRLEIDSPTAPLVILLLEKLQIVEINEKDIIDLIMLLREHDVGSHDSEMIDVDYLAALCSKDWGLWKTVTTNLKKIHDSVERYGDLQQEDREDVCSKVQYIADYIDRKPKTLAWKIRARIGEKKTWYEIVEEIHFEN